MWIYEKRLQFPVKIKTPNPATARIIISQLGGPDGELAASMRYLNQRFSMPHREIAGILTDIGTEELAHLEMIGSILHQLTRCLGEDDIKKSGFDTYFIDHTTGVFPQAASGVPADMKYIGVKGDVLADLHEDMSAEQKARVTYDNLLRLIDDHDVCEPLKFLRAREIVHYQRFGDTKLLFYTDYTDIRNNRVYRIRSACAPAQKRRGIFSACMASHCGWLCRPKGW